MELFSTDGLLRKASVFDTKKLEWMNGQHLSMLPVEDVAQWVTPALVAAGLATPHELATRHDWYRSLLELLRVRARTIDDVVRQAEPYFREHIEYDPEAVAKQWKDRDATAAILRGVRHRLAEIEEWSPEPMESSLREFAESVQLSAGRIFQPLRVALTGLGVSPGIFDVLVMLGRERSLARLDAALAQVVAAG